MDLAIQKATTEGVQASRAVRAVADALVVVDDASLAHATAVQTWIHNEIKTWTGKKDAWCKPIRKVANDISATIKGVTDPLEAAKAMLLRKMGAYQAEQRRLAGEQLKAATTPAEVQQTVAVMVQAPAGTVERTVYSAEVTDESLIPREYWILDQAKLNAVARATKGTGAIPGVKMVAETKLGASGR